MALTCTRCGRGTDYSGERPSFCAYCGHPFPGSVPPEITRTEVGADATVDYRRVELTSALPGTMTRRAPLPESIAGYRLIRKLGQGGMGSVHEAEDSTSGRRVALKLIAPEYTASSPAVERFLQEGRLASAITHPRCVFVLAADQADGWPYIVMELMPGDTLKDLVESQGPLPQGEAVRKIMDVIEGLEEAHRLGVIHRDVKPSNCFLDAHGRVKVGDFGLSKSLLGSDANLTRTGSFLGTPHYASPEQIKGELIDARSDVYSVAATLFYLLTGKPPFEANDATVALARIVSDEPPTVRSIRPEVWSALDSVVLRGLERDRRKRFRSLEEFREALFPFLPGRVALGRVGLRVAAYAFDFCVNSVLISLALILTGLARELMPGTADQWLRGWQTEVLTAIVVVGYFALSEVFGTATLGKRLFRLRVASVARGGPAPWRDAIVRLLVFAAVVVVPRRVCTIFFAHRLRDFVSIGTFVQAISFPALFLTARASNGYRGLHEGLSRTAVISLPGMFRRRKAARALFDPAEPSLHMARPEGLPAAVGPFEVDGALVWTGDRRVLLGEDSGLGRPVWIVIHPSGSPPTSTPRRDVGRISRPRWLGSGEIGGRAWDAFVAPIGRPLPDLVRTLGGLDWPQARSILEALAIELDASCEDKTLGDGLCLDRIWVKPDGRVLLLDRALDPLAGSPEEVTAPDDQSRALELLRRAAVCAMGGTPDADPSRPVPVGGPAPGHAIPALDRLCRLSTPYAAVAEFRADLDLTRDCAPEMAPFQRLGHAAYTLVATTVKAWLLPAAVTFYLILLSVLAREPAQIPTEADFDRILQFQSILWVLLAMLIREGVGGLLFSATIVRADGRAASRLRLAWREASLWLPLLVADKAFELIPLASPFVPLREYGTGIVALIIPVAQAGHALIDRGRYLNDRFARTAVVPK